MIVWIVGLAGSGKTTVGRQVHAGWQAADPATVLIDGDEMRAIFAHDRGEAAYTVEGRRINSDRIRALCAWLDRQGINVVCCILSIFPEARAANREEFPDYLEVWLDAPRADLDARRPIYGEARAGTRANVVGVDIPFEAPAAPDLHFDTGSATGRPAEEIAAEILRRIGVAE